MTCVSNGCNARFDWLILGHYSPVMFTGRLPASKTKVKSHIIKLIHLESSVFRRKSLGLAVLRHGLGLSFSRKVKNEFKMHAIITCNVFNFRACLWCVNVLQREMFNI